MDRTILYHTVGCHLCEVAEQQLQSLQQLAEFEYRSVDIATEEALVERYGLRIPVVRILAEDEAESDYRQEQELGWPFSVEQLRGFLFTS